MLPPSEDSEKDDEEEALALGDLLSLAARDTLFDGVIDESFSFNNIPISLPNSLFLAYLSKYYKQSQTFTNQAVVVVVLSMPFLIGFLGTQIDGMFVSKMCILTVFAVWSICCLFLYNINSFE